MNLPAIRDVLLASVVVVLGAIGTYLLLPHRHGWGKPERAHALGGILTGVALVLLMAFWTPPGAFLAGAFFYAFALAAIAGGALMVTSRDPVYSALWFASVILSTSGLFLLAGAQFLAAGTVIVYAGAIIVTFLFVIMLAQSGGRAAYDRAARAPARATVSCFLLLWALMYALLGVRAGQVPTVAEPVETRLVPSARLIAYHRLGANSKHAAVIDRALRPTALLRDWGDPEARPGVPPPHVAGLGGTLYTDHLISAEVAGVLLFVALVGALAIATPKPPVRPGMKFEVRSSGFEVPSPH